MIPNISQLKLIRLYSSVSQFIGISLSLSQRDHIKCLPLYTVHVISDLVLSSLVIWSTKYNIISIHIKRLWLYLVNQKSNFISSIFFSFSSLFNRHVWKYRMQIKVNSIICLCVHKKFNFKHDKNLYSLCSLSFKPF